MAEGGHRLKERTADAGHPKGAVKLHRLVLVGIAFALVWAVQAAHANGEGFEDWLENVKAEAAQRGLASEAISAALGRTTYLDRVVELDRRQPEMTQTFWRYIDRSVTPERIADGRAYLEACAPLLNEVYERFGVPPRLLVALWGAESDYGRSQGDFDVVSAIATLAFDSRRSSFFRQQLFALLDLIQRGDISYDVRGSWAGAIGPLQFMPTTIRDYAVDFDGDGRRDLQGDTPDVLASAANYLAGSGWNRRSSWGQEARLPDQFEYAESGLEIERPVYDWRTMGVEDIQGTSLPDGNTTASVLLPAGARGPAFLVYHNFRVILRWNNSVLYALAVGHLSDRIGGGGPLLSPRPAEELALTRYDVVEIQSLLLNMGFEAGEPDGIVGERTRRAIRMFQKSVELPADGYPDPGLLQQLRMRAMN
jgi:membrane-bound lytic murein transglycosylase B